MKGMSKKSKKVLGLILLIACIVAGAFLEARAIKETSCFDINSIPEYTDKIYITLNNNMPYFSEKEYTQEPFERYSKLDSLGRCRSCICKCLQGDNA